MKARRHTVVRLGTVTCLVAGLLAAADASAQQGPGGWSAEPPVSPALSRDADIFDVVADTMGIGFFFGPIVVAQWMNRDG